MSTRARARQAEVWRGISLDGHGGTRQHVADERVPVVQATDAGSNWQERACRIAGDDLAGRRVGVRRAP